MATLRIDQLNNPTEEVVEKSNIIPIDEFFDDMYLAESEKEERKDLARNIYVILSALLTIIKANQVLKNDHDIEYYKEYLTSNLEIVFDNTFGPGSYRSIIENFASEFIDSTMRHIDKPYFTSDDRAIVNAEQQSNAVYNQQQYEQALASGKTKKTWVTMHDKRVRKNHDAADGQEVAIDKPFEVGDSELMFPCDISLGANLREICNCRCVVVYSGEKEDRVEEKYNPIIPDSKIVGFMLNPNSKHYQEFTDVGYSKDNPEQLKNDILKKFDYNKAVDHEDTEHGHKFSIMMSLGVNEKRTFRSVWQIDNGTTEPRIISAYRDRRGE